MTNRQACLRKLCAVRFRIFDIHLYLDTHPSDIQMLALCKKFESEYMLLKQEYEEKFGCIDMQGCHGVEWLKDPWPWDMEGCN
ncbi:MAG: spore coat protein CotJB [Oscillospiraceae bacterium]|nr:spore coat protein CotJB [Oscillospiraceae bacterium]